MQGCACCRIRVNIQYFIEIKTPERMLCPYFLLEKEVKQKINSLRSYYSNELAKYTAKGGAGTNKVYQSKWPFFSFIGIST